MIINAGLQRVVYAGHYPDTNAVAFLDEAGVELQAYPIIPDAQPVDEAPLETN
jgi:deoxycytidylate deaminase